MPNGRETKTAIQCVENGPYMVKGPVALKEEKGEPIETTVVMSSVSPVSSKLRAF